MAQFRYKGVSPAGAPIQGILGGATRWDVQKTLEKQGTILLSLKKVGGEREGVRLKDAALLHFTKTLHRLVSSAIPLYEALQMLEEQSVASRAASLIFDLRQSLQEGQSLSIALSRHTRSFDVQYVAMISSAESSGQLPAALESMAGLIARRIAIRKKIIAALTYPTLLLLFCFSIFFALLFYLVPMLADLFEGRQLHTFTRFVLSLSRFAIEYRGLLAGMMGGILGLGLLGVFTRSGKRVFYSCAMRIGPLARLLMAAALIRFCRALGALLQAGVPFIDALDKSLVHASHPVLEETLQQAREKILSGTAFSDALRESKEIPNYVVRMLSIAEKSGNLPSILQQIAALFEEELTEQLTLLTSYAQPVLLLFLGAIIGFVLLGVLLPLTDVGSFL